MITAMEILQPLIKKLGAKEAAATIMRNIKDNDFIKAAEDILMGKKFGREKTLHTKKQPVGKSCMDGEICTVTVGLTEEGTRASGLSPVDVIREYKEEILDAYGELLTAVTEMDGNLFAGFTDAVSAKVFQVRTAFLLDGSDTETDWLDLGLRFLSLQMRASKVDCREVYERAGFLVMKVRAIIQKIKRQEVMENA